MSEHIHINIKHTRSIYLWFEAYGPNHPEVIAAQSDPGKLQATVSYNYDYERMPDNIWLLHVYLGIKVLPVAQIQTASTFEIQYAGQLVDILGLDALTDVGRIAFDNCTKAFKERCDHHGIVFTGTIPNNLLSGFEAFVRTSYAETRLPNEGPLLNNSAQSTFTTGNNTKLLLKVPFIIMDEVFFPGTDFDHAHNGKHLQEYISLSGYYTLKLRCITIDNGTVNLPLLQTMYFLICLDCALQLMVGQHADRLTELLAQRGLATPELRRLFYRTGSEYLSYTREQMKKSKTRLTNYENRPNWDRVVRLK